MSYPDTIHHPAAFNRNLAAGFDGIFNWSWTQGCFGDTIITPMDFDGVVERRQHFLVFETKEPGVEISQGQLITLDSLMKPKSFFVMKIWGKNVPMRFETQFSWVNGTIASGYGEGVEMARKIVKGWFLWADSI